MPETEQFIALAGASAHCAGRPHIGTLMRWAIKGVGPNHIKLETWKVGGRRYTTREAIDRFVARLSGTAAEAAVLSGRRAESVARDERELDADGITAV
jgi:hypothetical protein